MSRAKQRENRRKKHYEEANGLQKPWLNSESYHDPTAYQAICNIEREQNKDGHHGPAISQK